MLVGLLAATCEEKDVEELIMFDHGSPAPRETREATLDVASKLASNPDCEVWVQELAKLFLTVQIGWDIVDAGDNCARIDSELLEKFSRDAREVRNYTSYHTEFIQSVMTTVLLKLEWALHVLENKAAGMTTRKEEEFHAIALTLNPTKPLDDFGEAKVLCITGFSLVAGESMVFSHFIWGHFWPTFSKVTSHGYLHPKTQLIFSSKAFMCPKSIHLAYYNLFFDSLPYHDPECTGAEEIIELDSSVPIMVQYGNTNSNQALEDKAVWDRHLLYCNKMRPWLHPVLAHRLRLQSRLAPKLLYLRRGWLGAVRRVNDNEASRNLLNDAEVGLALQSLEGLGGTEVEITTLDVPWHEQVRLVGSSHLLIGLHGSAMGSHELWLPNGSILVNIFSPGSCECRWAYCASAPEGRLLYVVATTQEANCQLGGPWLSNGREGDFVQPQLHYPHKLEEFLYLIHGRRLWNYTRYYNPTELVTGLREVIPKLQSVDQLAPFFAAWALERGHAAACGGMALQMIDDGAGATDELIAALSAK